MRAENGAQTRDPQLGRLVLYQLSYFRKIKKLLWVVMDSNHRRHSQQIYSLPHLATLVTTLKLVLELTSTLHLSFEPLVGFEPTTPRLQITCSGQLS